MYTTSINGPLSSIGLQAGMEVRGDGVDPTCQLVNSDPLDQYSVPYTGPDISGYYTLYLSQPNLGAVTTASFTGFYLLDITSRGS